MNEAHDAKPIAEIIRRMKPLPRQHRIAHLRALLCRQMPGSADVGRLAALLRDEIAAQPALHRGRA